MNDNTPPWVERLIQSNLAVAAAMEAQAASNTQLAAAIVQLLADQLDEDENPHAAATYLDTRL